MALPPSELFKEGWSRPLPRPPHRTLDALLPIPRQASARCPPQPPEHAFHLHHVLDLLAWEQPHRPVCGVRRGAVIDDGSARVPPFGFDIDPEADPPSRGREEPAPWDV